MNDRMNLVSLRTDYTFILLLLEIKENNYIINDDLKERIEDLIDGEYKEKVLNRLKYLEKRLQ